MWLIGEKGEMASILYFMSRDWLNHITPFDYEALTIYLVFADVETTPAHGISFWPECK